MSVRQGRRLARLADWKGIMFAWIVRENLVFRFLKKEGKMYWMIIIVILAVAVWLGWEIKNAPLMKECDMCGVAVYSEKTKHMKKEKYCPIAVCPYCLARAKEQGFEVYETTTSS